MKRRNFILVIITMLIVTECTSMGVFPNKIADIEENAEEPMPTTTPAVKLNNKEDVNSVGDDASENESGQKLTKSDGEDKNGTGNSINPLTGLPVNNPENLLLPPALVSVTNFPPTARPQAGLTTSPIVFEIYIGDGMTRYLAIFLWGISRIIYSI